MRISSVLRHQPSRGLKIGLWRTPVRGPTKSGCQRAMANGFDAARLGLLPTYQFNDNIIFNYEIEFERTSFDADDKPHGTAEIEQA